MRTILLRTNVTALVALATLAWVVEVTRAQGGGDTATHEVGHWLAKYSVPPQIALGMINDEPVMFWSRAQLRVFANGRARGTIQLREVGGDRKLLYRVIGGELIDDRESGPKLALLLMQVGKDGEPLGLVSRAELTPNGENCFVVANGDIICYIVVSDRLILPTSPAGRLQDATGLPKLALREQLDSTMTDFRQPILATSCPCASGTR